MITQQPVLDVKQYWLPAIIGAAGGIIGSALGWGSQSSINKANLELAKYKYEKDLEMWNRQNAYNTPAAQMQRYAQAGINPNIIASQGNAGNATGMPEYSAPDLKAYNGFGDLGASAASQAILKKYEIDNQSRSVASQENLNSALGNKASADALLANQRAQTEYWQGMYKAKEYGILDMFGEETSRKQLELIEANQAKIKQDIEESKSRVGVNLKSVEKMDQDISESLSRIGLNSAKVSEIRVHIPVLMAQADKLSAEERAIVLANLSHPNPMKQKEFNEKMLDFEAMIKDAASSIKDKEKRTWFIRTFADYALKYYGITVGAGSSAVKAAL